MIFLTTKVLVLAKIGSDFSKKLNEKGYLFSARNEHGNWFIKQRESDARASTTATAPCHVNVHYVCDCNVSVCENILQVCCLRMYLVINYAFESLCSCLRACNSDE